MKRALGVVFVSLSLVPLTGCEADDPEDTPLHFTEASLESLPLVGEEVDAGAEEYSVYAAGPETAADYLQLAKFFHYECHVWPHDNFCPPDVDVTENGGMNSTKFTNDTLMGLIYHAEMKMGGLKAACGLSSGTIDGASFQAAGGDGADPDRYVLDLYDLYTCKGSSDADGTGVNTLYEAYSVARGYQATLATAFRHHAPETPESEQTDIYQIYVGVDRTGPRILAFNFAGASSMYNRAILIANFATHRFVAKYLAGGSDMPDPWITAVGVGGIDRATGAAYAGHYWAAFTDVDNVTAIERCVDNVGQLVEADDAPCAAEGIPVAWQSAGEIAAYLGLSAVEQTRLAAFLDKLATSDPLPSSEVAHSDEEVDLYFPSSIE